MMRKTSLLLLGAAAGVAVTLIATPPRIVLDGARAQTADADTYRQLSMFGDVFERLRADYEEIPTTANSSNRRSSELQGSQIPKKVEPQSSAFAVGFCP